MMKKLSKITFQLLGGANVATILMMLLTGYSDHLRPEHFPLLANGGLLFPIFLVLNMAFLVLWVVVKPRGVVIPVAGLLACFGPVWRYCPMKASFAPPPDDAIKVLSFNVNQFDLEEHATTRNAILQYIRRQDADIVCLQESGADHRQAIVDSVLNPIYRYRDRQHFSGDEIAIYSKYPILSHEQIKIPSQTNQAAAFRLHVKGRDVIVVNTHLETTGLSLREKGRFKRLVDGDLKRWEAKQTSELLVHKLSTATQRRAPQADAVARYISFHRGTPMIVCGDFNDSPVSYTHRTIARGLTDCYVETGFGPGISYHKDRIYVRIDNILCTDDFTPYRCRVDRSVTLSDHYPILCWLKMRQKSK